MAYPLSIDLSAQFAALVINGFAALLLGVIAYGVRRAFLVIKESLENLEHIQERVGELESNDRLRAHEYQGIRDELFYLKGKVGVPMSASVDVLG